MKTKSRLITKLRIFCATETNLTQQRKRKVVKPRKKKDKRAAEEEEEGDEEEEEGGREPQEQQPTDRQPRTTTSPRQMLCRHTFFDTNSFLQGFGSCEKIGRLEYSYA
ncbi:unnamed protein product [Caenorhabditis auriculariae]|uniref:Uncharacterized protein n=1 Tax=Caenorhabditis auriculariae TaxID=2777116 RepID=A0A8S1HN97_9PELO|nr:unnamed protein product [Caenorhabditis auriculariae]